MRARVCQDKPLLVCPDLIACAVSCRIGFLGWTAVGERRAQLRASRPCGSGAVVKGEFRVKVDGVREARRTKPARTDPEGPGRTARWAVEYLANVMFVTALLNAGVPAAVALEVDLHGEPGLPAVPAVERSPDGERVVALTINPNLPTGRVAGECLVEAELRGVL